MMMSAALALVLLGIGPTPGLTPTQVVKLADDSVAEILKSPKPSVAELATVAESFIDFTELAKRALGKPWDTLKPDQQVEFAKTMNGLLRASYAQKAIQDGRENPKISYGKESVDKSESSVETKLSIKTDTFPIVYKLFRKDPKSAWHIYDVVTDEVSLVTTYSDQFKSVLAKKGFDGLLKTLKARKESLEKKP